MVDKLLKSGSNWDKEFVRVQLNRMLPLLQKYALGDFSETIEIPDEDNEFTELIVGITLMVDDIKLMMKELERSKIELSIRNRIANIFLTVQEESIYDNVLKIVMDSLKSKYGMFGYIDDKGDLVIPTIKNSVWNECKLKKKNAVFPKETWDNNTWQCALKEKRIISSNVPSRILPGSHREIDNHIASPIIYKNEVIGLLIIANKAKGYNDEDLRFITLINNTISPILNSRLEKNKEEKKRLVAEDNLRKYKEHLEDIVKERTSTLKREIKYRRAAEEKIKESEERYRDLFESANDLIQSVDINGNYVYVNNKWLETLGYEKEELKQLSIKDIIHKDQVHHCMDIFDRVSKGELVDKIETIFVSKDGREIAVEGNINAKIRGNEFISTRGIFRDITDRLRAENALKESEEKFRLLFQKSNEGIIYLDPEGKLMDANPKIIDFFGLKYEEIIGENVFDIISNGNIDISTFSSTFKDTISGIIPKNTEFEFKNYKGNKFTFLTHPSIIKKDNEMIGISMIIEDITESKIKEMALRESSERFRNLFEHSNDAIFIHANGKILDVNHRACELTGYRKDVLLKKTMEDLYLNNIIEDLQKTIKIAKNKTHFLYETKIKKSNKEVIDVEFSGKLIDNKKFIIQEIARDITERKEAEKKKNQLFKELANKNKELDDYTYIVSHDLKAPLVTIQGFSDLIMRKYGDKFDEKASHYFDNIIKGSQEMSYLINKLLELSRAGGNKQEFKKLLFRDEVKSSLSSMKGMIDKSNAKIKINDFLDGFDYDPTQLRQVFTNLISNAIKYSNPENEPNIEIGGRWNDNNALIWVQDNGLGIAKEDQKKIFQPFFRVTKDKNGTGVGLSIVKKIIEKHGGNLWVESNIGNGSTFYFTVPKVLK